MRKGPLLIGTSGWQYRDWRGRLYEGVPQKRWLEHYARNFATVEINAAFYRLPSPETFRAWRERTPDDFVMAVKASRYLTHVRRLQDPSEPVRRLLSVARGLGDRLGPILLQLPPTLRADAALLADCLDAFPPGVDVVVEPRHDSWYTPQIRELLTARNAALCWADRLGRALTPLWRTASWGYLRLHEGASEEWPDYDDATLLTWVERLGDMGEPFFVYFNNDPNGAAVRNAIRFAQLAEEAGIPVTRVPSPAALL
ncbi:DUF72 domain-containing protein [Thermomonospora cellulosilytica]|uniref:Uncharacterized protein YecE (DUF72 family) n=1 Tax=Thermomonospora cellulosilytica TaxID=1411118 RepID=A0A7W3MYU3_9ACTN|nr:DUF72 domain-containing protein [Thermomonospora cellulosilytica]MBA9004327.1 uncharacterized protein YecE (DUF72 family) [Thermomonospora cellulosilytica]